MQYKWMGVLSLIFLPLVSELPAQNLLSNPGWDDQAATISLTGTSVVVIESGVLTDWQAVIVDVDSGSGTAQYISAPDAQAISAPNALTIKRGDLSDSSKNVDDCQIRKDSAMSALTDGNIYRHSLWARDLDGNLHNLLTQVSLFDSGPAFLQPNGAITSSLTSDWERFENTFSASSGSGTVAYGSLGIIPLVNGFEAQIDSALLEDITLKNRMVNGGFENSDTRLLDWDTFAVGGDTIALSIVSDASEGSNALRMERTATGSGDAGASKDGHQMPWLGTNDIFISLDIKDDTTVTTGEYVTVRVCAFDSASAFLGCPVDARFLAGDGQYETYTVQSTGNVPAGTAKITISLRVSDNTGAGITGDVLVDNIVIGDATAGFATQEISALPLALSYAEGSGYEVDVEAGETSGTRQLTIYNDGTDNLVVSALDFSGDNAAEFSIDNAPSLPVTVYAGDPLVLDVRFTPAQSVRTMGKTATLTIESNDPATPQINISISADATPVSLSGFELQ